MNHWALLIILFAHFFSNLNIASSIDNHNQGTNIDRIALLALKSGITYDPHGVLNNWNKSVPICQWQGVTCGAKDAKVHGRVVALYLVSTSLVGTLSPFVGNLSFLHHLHLSDNSIQGSIPPQIGHLHRLRSLVLERNSFTGEVPANISRCLNLETLSLGGNKLNGTIPLQLSLLSNLKVLALQENKLTGNLLDIVVNVTSLQKLSAAVNFFDGNIPHSIGQCKNLTYIALAQNKISGTFPPSFYNLSSLQVIDFDLNQLEGTLPPDIGFRFPQLGYFKISGNSFHGQVPVSLSNLTQLVKLAIYSNNFAGKFLFDARNVPNLELLDISLNYLGTGEADDLSFLQFLADCNGLYLLECGGNNFGGTLPHYIGNLSTELKVVDFQSNQITGNIPSELFNLINIEQLGLSDNHLTGYLSSEVSKLTKLEVLSCSNNNLDGNIPYTIGNLSKLSSLFLNNNNFEGLIPSSLGDCKNLLYLQLSRNNLNESLPPHLFHASMLVEIHLDQNYLQGNLPGEIVQLKNLVLLDASGNAFTGNVPSSLGGCINLVDLNLGRNLFSGFIPESFKSLTSLRNLNLSHNRFSGQIPVFFSNLSILEIDLSFNSLEGEVPRHGVFTNLTAVSVSGNSNLCGGIPELHLPTCPDSVGAGQMRSKSRKLSHLATIIVASACSVGVVSLMSLIYLLYFRGKKKKLPREPSMREPFPRVSYDMLMKATDSFSEANLLGRGSFGSVYKGVLGPEKTVVAVKVINLERQGASKSFMAECDALKNIRHRNLLKIVTACSSTDFHGNDFKALVYEFMPNGNLQQLIHVDNQDGHQQSLSLLERLNIAIDMGCALDYLHNGGEIPIIHCDLKPSNILLNDDMVAHIGDFGLARLRSQDNMSYSSSIVVRGTVGYAPPEYGLGSMISKEGDVYSYGIVLIEMMTAKQPTDRVFERDLNLHTYAKESFSNQLARIIDPRLLDEDVSTSNTVDHDKNLPSTDSKIECIKSVIEIGVKCSVESPQDRMSMKDAIRELQSASDTLLRLRNAQRYPLSATAAQ